MCTHYHGGLDPLGERHVVAQLVAGDGRGHPPGESKGECKPSWPKHTSKRGAAPTAWAALTGPPR